MRSFDVLPQVQKDGVIAILIVVVVACAGVLLKRFVFGVLRRFAARRGDDSTVFAAVLHRASAPCAFIVPLVAVEAAFPALHLAEYIKTPLERVLGLCIIAAIAWALVALIELATDLSKRRFRLDTEDNLHARQAETRLDILNRTAITLVVIVAVASMLMTFPAIRTIGATLLASAGLVGLAAGFAARPFLENLVAGIQIALTQPIRIDDVVFVEKEFGHIEKITATYVVVRVWDQRRMVLPLSYFINTPFQNWTYNAAKLTGSIELHLDYSVPISALREAGERILRDAPQWNGETFEVSMIDAQKDFADYRVLVSARNAAQLWDLRCLVREQLIAFIATTYPSALPGLHPPAIAATPGEQPAPAGGP